MEKEYYELSAKVLNKKASLDEQEMLNTWLARDPDHQQQFQEMKQLWELTAPGAKPEVDKEAAWNKIRQHLPLEKRKVRVIHMFPVALKVAASVAFLALFVWLINAQFLSGYGLKKISADTGPMGFFLPDSSHVWLNKGSSIVYDPDFDGEERNLKLEGEAFFEVTHNPQRPFVVSTERSETRVLGTSFNLRAYGEEATTELAVASGKVAFSSIKSKDARIVPAGYAVTLLEESNRLSESVNFNKNAFAWKSRELIFSEQPLSDVIRDLERYYNVEVQLFPKSLSGCRFSGTFRDASIEEVTQILGVALQLQVKKENKNTYHQKQALP